MAVSFATTSINATFATLMSIIPSTINAGNAQINLKIVELVRPKPATNALIPLSSRMGSVFPVEISVQAVRDARRKTYAWSAFQMLSTLSRQSAISVWIRCNTVKPVKISHFA